MKCRLFAILLVACLAPAMANVTVVGVIYAGSYPVHADSIKFATSGGLVMFPTPGWSVGAEQRDTARFSISEMPTFFGLYYHVESESMPSFNAAFQPDTYYFIPVHGAPRQHFPTLTWLPVGIEEENRMRIDADVSVAPNPFSTRTTIRLAPCAGGSRQVGIFDRSGILVRSLEAGAAGTTVWDGRDAGGRRLAAGTYFAIPAGSARRSSTKLILTD